MKHTLIALFLSAAPALGAATYDGSMLYGYCTNPQAPLQFPETTTAGMAMQFTESDVAYFKGYTITAICIANGSPAAKSTAASVPVTLFTCSGFETNGTASNLETYQGTMDLTTPYAYTEYPLPHPITVTDDTAPFWVGVMAECNPAEANPLMFDSFRHTGSEGGMVGVVDAPGLPMQFTDMSASYGFGCIRLKIEGKNLPGDEASFIQCHIPEFGFTGEQTAVDMYLLNGAGNDINSLTVTYTLGNEKGEQKYDLPTPLIYNNYTQLSLPIPLPQAEQNNLELNVEITQVNGQPNSNTSTATANHMLLLDRGNGFRRNMVAEIATGTWCGYCPMGFVGVEKMLKAHPDGSFIPIAVHTNDQMTTASYDLFRTNFVGSSAPQLIVNRNVTEYGNENPTWEMMSGMYPFVTSTPAMAQLSIDGVTEGDRKLTVDASVRFAMAGSGDYGLAYVLTEDNVGPYAQLNYYNMEGAPEMGEWNNLPEVVENCTFSAVARQINLFNGVKNSVPETFEAATDYGHSAELRTNTMQNLQNCHITVMLVNRTTGRIENAVTAPYSHFSSISTISAERSSGQAVYDLQGRRVTAPASGRPVIKNGKITI